MDMTRSTLTKTSAVREVVYSRSRMSRKGIPGKNRQNKEAGQNSTQLVVRGGQLRKLRWQRILILRLFLHSPQRSRPIEIALFWILPTPSQPENTIRTYQFLGL
jgi:hypothetical protein